MIQKVECARKKIKPNYYDFILVHVKALQQSKSK